VPSQRWRTFVRNHARALIVSGIAADLLTRGVRALFARLRRPLQQWWDWSVAREWPGSSPCDAVAMALLRETMSAFVTWSPDTGDGRSVVERSPPAMGSPQHHAPCPATRAPQGDTVVVCPIRAARAGWDRAGRHSREAQSLRRRETRAAPLQRAA
jgi:hypothetical protein